MCTDLQMCRVPPYVCQMLIRIAGKELSAYSIDGILDRRSSIKNTIALCWKWTNNAVMSPTVGAAVLRFNEERLMASGFASQYHFCHRISS